MKKKRERYLFPKRYVLKSILVVKLVGVLLCCASLQLSAKAFSQQLSIKMTNVAFREVAKEVERQTGMTFLYNDMKVNKLNQISLDLENSNLDQVMKVCLAGSGLSYRVVENTVIIMLNADQPEAPQQKHVVKGKVVDASGVALPGVTVLIKGTQLGTSTDAKGDFTIEVGDAKDLVLVFSFVGMEKKEVLVKDNKELRVVMEETTENMNEVVVTGIYERKKESFTGSASTYTSKDLKNIGTQNIIQSLKTLDPAFLVLENNQFGSDPNRLPDIEIRGKSSLLGVRDELAENPNQPLFILDGFESSLRAIFDLDMERVASITILKDAASTAIYGSKAANGVVVVETVRPTSGKLRFSYSGSLNLSLPDLSSYNMMNAAEKVEFEYRANRYVPPVWSAANELEMLKLYNEKLQNVAEGIDTYWLAEPLRVGVNHKHSVYAQGGEGAFQFGIGMSYNGIAGVMKESRRKSVTGNLDLSYRMDKFQFSNKFQLGNVNTNDPLVAFSNYVNANPYYKKYDEYGKVTKWLEYNDFFKSPNPLWNDRQNSRKAGHQMNFSNYFMVEYFALESLRFRGRFGLTYGMDEKEEFRSPNDTKFEGLDILNKGTYGYSGNKSERYEGELAVTYAKVIEKHRINLVGGGNMNSSSTLLQGYDVSGFPQGDFTYPSFSKGYPEGARPSYVQSDSRSLSAYANAGYAYDERYLLDLSYRINGSSVFGTTRRYTGTWSVGLAWNMHKERFIQDHFEGITMLKLRGSVGTPGNQNFSSYMTLTTYQYSFSAPNYFGMSTVISTLGNPDLKWQKTLDKNLGLDVTVLNNRLNVNLDVYQKDTDPLLVAIQVPSSSGVNQTYTNIGKQLSKGLIASAQYYLIYQPAERKTLSFRGTLRTESAELAGIGNSLNELNKVGQSSNNLKRYYDGSDPDAVWAVRSAGIDPATGREIFYKKDGSYTYDFSYEDEVIIGKSRPKIEGVLGSSFNYKGFSVNLDFRYRRGAQVFNQAVFTKVENISKDRLNYNQDKRALYDRWREPGQVASFKDIATAVSTPMSSRFVQQENTLALESFRIGYEFSGANFRNTTGLGTLRLNAYMNDIFRISSIKAERGIDYPFARNVSFALSTTF